MTTIEKDLLAQMKDAVTFYREAMELLCYHSENQQDYDFTRDTSPRIERWRDVIAKAEGITRVSK